MGAGLSRADRNAITDFIRNYPYGGDDHDLVKEEVRRELDDFKHIVETEPPETSMTDLKEGKITVFDWWRNETEFFPRLGKLAERIFTLTPSTASVERSFKSRGLIHTKTRNRLGSETTSKLTFLKMNAPLLHRSNRNRRARHPVNQVQEHPGGGDAEEADGEMDTIVEILETETEYEEEVDEEL